MLDPLGLAGSIVPSLRFQGSGSWIQTKISSELKAGVFSELLEAVAAVRAGPRLVPAERSRALLPAPPPGRAARQRSAAGGRPRAPGQPRSPLQPRDGRRSPRRRAAGPAGRGRGCAGAGRLPAAGACLPRAERPEAARAGLYGCGLSNFVAT